MGCDIHLFAEQKIDGAWTLVEDGSTDFLHRIKDFDSDDDEAYDLKQYAYRGNRFYTCGRNYNLFSALCGVRSWCFEKPPKPVYEKRGVPKDSCKHISDAVAFEGQDAHSHSWLTLQDLKEYDWSEWGNTCDEFINEVIPKLEQLNNRFCRIVFWFDN